MSSSPVNGWFWTILLLPVTLPIAILMSLADRNRR